MTRAFVRTGAAAAAAIVAAAAFAAPLHAQRATGSTGGVTPQRTPFFQLAPYAGYMFFGDIVQGPLGTSVKSANGPLYGAQLGFNVTPNIALIGNVARASGDLQVGIPFLGGFDIGQSSAWLYDGGVQLSMPLGDRTRIPVTPFVQLGAGAVRYTVSSSVVKTDATNFAANAGVGADIGIGSGISLRLLAKDYVGKFDVQEATTLGEDLTLGVGGKTSHNVGVTAGLKVEF